MSPNQFQTRPTTTLSTVITICIAIILSTVMPSSIAAAPPQESSTWVETGNMSSFRAGACSALLADGRVLITGGTGPAGVLATAEFFNAGGSFSSAAPMVYPRSMHSCVALADGRVLVTGGRNNAGVLDVAEIYDPAVNRWQPILGMLTARSGHTTSLLPDGRIVFAGGESAGTALASLEIFNPDDNSFALVPSLLSSPRKNHAAAVLQDGRVLLTGGSDGTQILNTADLFDPSTGAVIPAGKLSVARTGHTATTLLDGKVFLAGGNNGDTDLAPTELFDPASGRFSPAGYLTTPRRDHLALRIPNNNSILFAGGTSNGAPLVSTELYIPWTGDFEPTDDLDTTRLGATGSGMKKPGMVMMAGGTVSINAVTYTGATVMTDKLDYAPGQIVTITGTNWMPGETVNLLLHEVPTTHADRLLTAVADGSGNILNNEFSPEDHDVGVTFYLTATGQTSGLTAQTTFTDAELVTAEVTGTTNDVTVAQGSSVNFTINLTATGNIAQLITSGAPSTATVNTSYSLNAAGALSSGSPSGAFNFFAGSTGCTGGGTVNCDVTWTGAPTAYSVVASVSANVATPVGNYTITLSSAAGTTTITNPNVNGGKLADATATSITVHVVAPPNGTLTVNKVTVPTSDTGKFNLQIDSVTAGTGANQGNGGTTGAVTVSAGTHTVGETAGTGTSLSDYTSVISGDCAADGSVSVTAGQNKTCTITNTKKPKLTVNKVTVPAADSGVFNLQIDGATAGTGANQGNGGTTGAVVVSVGGHTVGETQGTGTLLSDYTSVIGGDCAADGTITLAAGDSKTCTITNSRKPKLTLNKVTVPTSDTGKFNLQIDGATAGTGADQGNGGTTGAVTVSVGGHTVGETQGTGTLLSDYTSVIGGDCAADGTITLAAGDNKTCTITNSRKPKLTVNKVTVPASDTGKFNLRIDGATAGTGADQGNGGTTGAVTVSIGSHTVSETAGTGASLSDYESVIAGDCAANGTITLAAGDNKTCTITNSRKPKLTVNKVTVPASDTGKFNLQIDGATAGTGADQGNGGTTGAVTVSIGGHTVGETAGSGTSLSDYESVIAGDCAANGTITLAAGDNKTCTITNSRKPKLTVNKVTVPASDTGKFNLQIDGATAGTGADQGNGGTTGAVTVSIGGHTVGETAGSGTSLSDYESVIAGDCAANGTITLAAGENKTCTITNTRKPRLTVNKVTVPTSDTGKFNLQIDGATAGSGANQGNGGTTGAVTVSIGGHTVGETAGTGTVLSDYTSVINGDCAADGTITLAVGDNKTCTITNTKKPKLIVNKVLLPSSDTGKFNLQIDGATAGTGGNVGNGGTTGAVIVTIGTHTVSETANGGTNSTDYDTLINGACDANGSVTLAAGDVKTCTITNTKKGQIKIVKSATPSVGIFTITVTGGPPSVNIPLSVVAGGSQTTALVSAGSGYVATETIPGGWTLTNSTCDSGSPTNITVNPGAVTTCTFQNNNPAPTATILGPLSGSVYAVNTPVNFTGTFTDQYGDTHTYQWKFDALSTPVANASPNPGDNGATDASYTFSAAGVYAVKLRVTDGAGQVSEATTVGGLDAMVVIYDPNAGFVTGGGWINSPAGAMPASALLTGKANFGFVSKYQKGQSTPTGETEFQFKVGNLNFHSALYEWLVVSGARAQYKGTGTINGAGNYGFLLTAVDGQINGGGGVDKFRIKIWDMNNSDTIVYDNQIGASDSAALNTALGGGSIVIHP